MNSTLFGAPLGYSVAGLDEWIKALTNCWRDLTDDAPGELEGDLDRLESLFAPGTSPKGFRSRVERLTDRPTDRLLPESVAIDVQGALLITPEGRILLQVLRQLHELQREVISPSQQIDALTAAVEVRASWHRTWVKKQLDGSLSPTVLGAAIFLLINGSVGREAALLLPSDEERDRLLGSAVLPVIGNFSLALGGKQPDLKSGLRSHWAFTQISRFLSRDVVRVSEPSGAAIYVKPGHEAQLLLDLAGRLAKFDREHLFVALNQFVVDYRQRRGRLTSLGVMHEDPTRTRRVMRSLAGRGQQL